MGKMVIKYIYIYKWRIINQSRLYKMKKNRGKIIFLAGDTQGIHERSLTL